MPASPNPNPNPNPLTLTLPKLGGLSMSKVHALSGTAKPCRHCTPT